MGEETKTWWWLSFVDRGQWLGVSIVAGANVLEAATNARFLGCNPGGSVLGEPFDEDEITPPSEYTNRLLGDADIEELNRFAARERERWLKRD